MTEKPKQTSEEELDYPNKYMYEDGILWECNDGCRFELLGDTVARLLNEQNETIQSLKIENDELKREVNLLTEFFRKNNFSLDDFNGWLTKERWGWEAKEVWKERFGD